MDSPKITPATVLDVTTEKIFSCPNDSKLFEIQTLEWLEQNRPFEQNKAYRTNSFEIIWVKKGSGVLSVDLQKNSILQDTIYCIAPRQLRLFQSINGMRGYYIALSAELLHTLENQVDFDLLTAQYGGGRNLPLVHTAQETLGELEELVTKMIREFQNTLPMKSELLKGYLKIFMIYMSRKITITEPIYHKDSEMVRKFMTLLKKNFATKKLVADYAEELCVTPNYLNLIVKKITGYPVSHHIQQYIILEAKRQALYSGSRMKEIADFLGFEDYAHFSKFFKNYSGMNFSNFKKGLQGAP
jgi:AraC family transcriptional regulator, transcriptional activator of pobA